MKKYIKKGISLALVTTITTWSLVGCGSTTDVKTTTTSKDTSEATMQVQSLLTSKVGDSNSADKKETVYVEMKADGTVSKTTVSDVITSTDKNNIDDVSELKNIINLSGNEKFALGNDDKVVWQNKGKEIKYQGTTTKTLPISVKVNYYLDGSEISPEDIVGKSGKIKIVYNYSNNTKENNEKFVPFIMVSGFVLNDDFKNVEVDNGKVIQYGDNNIVIGYGAPGLKDYLTDTIKNANDYMKDIDIPEGVTITADTTDFQMDMGITVATSQLSDIELKDSIDLTDIQNQMKELRKGANQLVSGTKTLSNGADKLKSGGTQLNTGAIALAKGTGQLSKGTSTLYNQYSIFNKALVDGVSTANKGSGQIYDGTKKVNSAAGRIKSGASKLNEGAKELSNGTTEIESVASALNDGAEELQGGFEDAKKQQGAVSGSKDLATGAKDANAGVKKVVKMLQSTPDSMDAQIEGIVSKISTATGGAINSKTALENTVEGINSAVKSGTDLNTVLTSKGLNTNTYYSLLEAYYSIKTLESVKGTFENQISSNQDDIKKLLEGMDLLETGAGKLHMGIEELYGGAKKLSAGTLALKTGATKLKTGAGTLKAGTSTLAKGTGQLKTGTNSLEIAMKTLNDGTKVMVTKIGGASPKIKTGISQINNAVTKLDSGASTLSTGITTANNGIIKLAKGATELNNGAIKLNEDGISKITSIFGDDAQEAIDQIEDMLNSGKEYKSFSGINKEMSGQVKFIFKTNEIKTEK